MLTLCHAPNSRSSRILTLIEEMGIRDEVALRPVTIRRFDDSGGPDAANPHPEGKVPLLDHDAAAWRSAAGRVSDLAVLVWCSHGTRADRGAQRAVASGLHRHMARHR